MREIKFKGLSNGKLYDLKAVNYTNMTGLCEVEDVIGRTWCQFEEFLEYTGFYDKDESEIFEEDVVETEYTWWDTSSGHKTVKARAVVKWGDGAFYFHPLDGNWIEDWNFADDTGKFKVIGNIYEHSHLLEKDGK